MQQAVLPHLQRKIQKGLPVLCQCRQTFLKKQMDSVFSDIKPDAVKIGMIASKEQVEIIAKYLQKYSIKQVVADPVMITTSGTVLVEEEVREVLYEKLFPNISLLTPNLPETEFLSGRKITDRKTREEAAEIIAKRWNCAVLSKGGHSQPENADDFLYEISLKYPKKALVSSLQVSIIQIPMEPGAHFQVR